MKNYKKIYNRLMKEIKDELDRFPQIRKHNSSPEEQMDLESQETSLNWILSLQDELEGKNCGMILMNQEEFKKWKKEINK